MWIVSVQQKHTGYTKEFDNEEDARVYYKSEVEEAKDGIDVSHVYIAKVIESREEQ